MNKSILVTGISGTGKSTIANELNNQGYKAISIEDIEGLCTIINKKTGKPFKNFDINNIEMIKQSDWICNKKKLQLLLRKNSKGIVSYCGSSSNFDEILPFFDKIFLLKTSVKVLRERLNTRTSNKFGRTAEVQKWVFGWKNWWEAHMKEKGAIVINASRPPQVIAKEIIKKSTNKR